MNLLDLSDKTKLAISIIVILIVSLIILYICSSILNKTDANNSDCNCKVTDVPKLVQAVLQPEQKIINKNQDQKNQKERKNRLCLYYADWCGYSRQFLPIWKKLKTEILSSNLKDKINLVEYECDNQKEICQQNGIRGYPTVILHKENGEKVEYQGQRETKEIIDFVKKMV